MGKHFVDFEVRTDRSFAIPAVRILLAGNAFRAVGDGGALAGIDPDVGGHIEGAAVTVVAVKTVDVWSVLDGLSEVDFLAVLVPVPAEVPLTDHLCGVAGLAQHVCDCLPFGWD